MSRLMQSLALDSKRVYLRCWFVLVSSEKLRRTFPTSRLVVFGRSVMRLELLQMFSVPCVIQLLVLSVHVSYGMVILAILLAVRMSVSH
jgi:hypothetical protein